MEGTCVGVNFFKFLKKTQDPGCIPPPIVFERMAAAMPASRDAGIVNGTGPGDSPLPS